MQQFTTQKEKFASVSKDMLTRLIPIYLFVILIVGLIPVFKSGTMDLAGIISISFLFVIMVINTFRSIGRQRKIFESYTLTFENELITRRQDNTPVLSIAYTDIEKIVKSSKGMFIIKGKTSDVILVPQYIQEYEQLEALLQSIHQVDVRTKAPLLSKVIFVFPLLTIGLLAGVLAASNKIIVAVCGTLILALLTYGFIIIQKSRNVDYRVKRGRWFMLVIAASVIIVMYDKLTGKYP